MSNHGIYLMCGTHNGEPVAKVGVSGDIRRRLGEIRRRGLAGADVVAVKCGCCEGSEGFWLRRFGETFRRHAIGSEFFHATRAEALAVFSEEWQRPQSERPTTPLHRDSAWGGYLEGLAMTPPQIAALIEYVTGSEAPSDRAIDEAMQRRGARAEHGMYAHADVATAMIGEWGANLKPPR